MCVGLHECSRLTLVVPLANLFTDGEKRQKNWIIRHKMSWSHSQANTIVPHHGNTQTLRAATPEQTKVLEWENQYSARELPRGGRGSSTPSALRFRTYFKLFIHCVSKNAPTLYVRFERRKVDKKQTCTKTEACKLYFRVFWVFLPNVIKIDPYNFELYRFKFGALLRHKN